MACYAAKLSVAGVSAGSDCFCGVESDLSSAAARARNRPKSECTATSCDADPHEKECGGPGRLLAYQFSCDRPAPPHVHPSLANCSAGTFKAQCEAMDNPGDCHWCANVTTAAPKCLAKGVPCEVPTMRARHMQIPNQTLLGGVKLPMLVMGDGVNWGRGTNWTEWINLVGPGAGIDSAWDYGSEPGIPTGIRASQYNRNQVFITSKIPCDHWDGGVEPMNASQAQYYIERNLEELNTSYVDLMLLHHICRTPAETAAVWGVLEAMKRSGKAKAIGVSNFEVPDLTILAGHAIEPIEVNQCHFGVGEMDSATIAYCREHNIALESYGTLHGSAAMVSNPMIGKIAAKYSVSAAVIMLKFVSQHHITIVTASDSLQYDHEDIHMFDFALADEDMATLKSLQGGKTRTCSDCWKDSCRACQAALTKAGCTPWSNSTCLTCATEHAKVVMPTCLDEAMVYKACINN